MKQYFINHLSLIPLYIVLLFSFAWMSIFYESGLNRLLITSDQLGSYYYQKKEYKKAAEVFENSLYKATSYYRVAEFKKAKSIYQNIQSKEGRYNLANTFVMIGDYDNAIKNYEFALRIDSNFKEARDNLVVAKARKILKEPENDGKQGVGDMYDLGADEILYDNTEKKGVDDDRSAQEDIQSGNPNWLDRIQTGPKDFLKNKFRYQYEMKESIYAK